MTVGQRIKYFRKMRGMTQTQLAVAAGMSEKNADVRITQYESEGRHPKKPLRESLARALHVSPAAISPPDMDSAAGVIQILFMMEDLYGIRIDNIQSELCLLIDPARMDSELSGMVMEWLRMSQRMENGELTKEEYDMWRYNAPNNTEGSQPLTDRSEEET
ncbi:MAG: helix-turn-helix domain-containing protein [Clostridiales bacterium]|nr:helix-turn-helix domain-containing protein [Clostridiales bacterium]